MVGEKPIGGVQNGCVGWLLSRVGYGRVRGADDGV